MINKFINSKDLLLMILKNVLIVIISIQAYSVFSFHSQKNSKNVLYYYADYKFITDSNEYLDHRIKESEFLNKVASATNDIYILALRITKVALYIISFLLVLIYILKGKNKLKNIMSKKK